MTAPAIPAATYAERWARAIPFDTFVVRADANARLWQDMAGRAAAPADLVERAQALAAPVRLLVLMEDWCGDAVNTIPVLDALVRAVPALELRVLRRDEHPDLMEAHLAPSGARAIPVVVALDAEFREVGWWGSRPRPLQDWVDTPEARAMEAHDRYREVRRWYARDRGRTALAEILSLLDGGAPGTGAATAGRPGPAPGDSIRRVA